MFPLEQRILIIIIILNRSADLGSRGTRANHRLLRYNIGTTSIRQNINATVMLNDVYDW
jgi:hypothetical protein